MLPEHYIQLADELVKVKTDDLNPITLYKTAIDRYYYGSLLLCKNVLFNSLYPYREKRLLNSDLHSVLVKVYLKSDLFIIGSLLEELKILKCEAEYNPAFTPTIYEVTLAKSYAYEIFSIVEEMEEEQYKKLRDIYLSLAKIA